MILGGCAEMKDFEDALIVQEESSPETDTIEKVKEFLTVFDTLEEKNDAKLLLMVDKRSNAFYLNCHLDSDVLASNADLDAVLDPEESEDYKLNREIYTDSHAYQAMESDAMKGRSFEDLVVEYDKTYRPELPLKVFGGQHRIKAVTKAFKRGVRVPHGVRVYFDLSINQKVNIAMANNTSIAVSNDLLDRMQEDLLGNDLRNFCQSVGLLEKGQNFVDRRSPEGIPTVRVARTMLANFKFGKETKEDDFRTPIVCSSGPGIDPQYTKVRDTINWSDTALLEMGSHFTDLHKLQRERVLGRKKDKYIEFANKAIHPCAVASWAYTAGFLQRNPDSLKNHYALAEISNSADPLNAKALSQARLKGVDPDTYRGLGARISSGELGRMLEVFLLQATKAKARGITPKLANAAIRSYEAKKAQHDADKALEKI